MFIATCASPAEKLTPINQGFPVATMQQWKQPWLLEANFSLPDYPLERIET
jgi:hypothetical protein